MIEQVLAFLKRLSNVRTPTGRQRDVAMVIALIAFVAMGTFALRSLPEGTTSNIDWALITAVGVIGPTVTIILNAMEFRAQGRMLGHDIGWPDAIRISTLSSAANLLPLPGSIVVRTGSLVHRGSTLTQATATGLIAGVAWIGSAFATAGLGALLLRQFAIGGVGLVIAVFLIAVSWQLAGRLTADARAAWPPLVGVEFALTFVSGARFFFVIVALGFDVSGGQALALTVSGAIASAAGIFPAGLGLREAMSAGVAALVDLPAAVGFVAASIDRVLGLAVLGLATLGFLVWGQRNDEDEPLSFSAHND